MEIDRTELSIDQFSPGVLKIFGETIVPGVQYKSVLASSRSTAQELVKQGLERYGVAPSEYGKFVLCDVVGRCTLESVCVDTKDEPVIKQRWENVCSRILYDKDRPLILQNFWRPTEGYSRRYELHRKSDFKDKIIDDDTSGLNNNARKILISKLRPGAIPLSSVFMENDDSLTDGLKWDYSYTTSESSKWMPAEDDSEKFIESLGSDYDVTKTLQSNVVEKHGDIMFNNCINDPFLLTLRGHDVDRDSVLYAIKQKTVLLGKGKRHLKTENETYIELYAPDIQSHHAILKLQRSPALSSDKMYNYHLHIQVCSSSFVKVNGIIITENTEIHSGDVLCLGQHYVFLFKDLTGGHDIPQGLPWLLSEQSRSVTPDPSSEDSSNVITLKLPPSSSDDEDSSLVQLSPHSYPNTILFPYSKEKEDELIKAIGVLVCQNPVMDFPLTAAYLFGMCIGYSYRTFDSRHTKNLMLRVLFCIRENVANVAKCLSANKFNCQLLAVYGSHADHLSRLILWMSNCVHFLLYIRDNLSLPENDTTTRNDDISTGLSELTSGLEEVITFCFQQSIYTITKALYGLLPAILDSNPFSDIADDSCGIERITTVFDLIADLTNAVMLHTDVTRQLFTYLFFFSSTSVFNRLFLDDAGPRYYHWSAGVRLRANLCQLEDCAYRHGLEMEFAQMFERLLTTAEFLSTSRNMLLKYDWTTMKQHFKPLEESQLYRLLMSYQLGAKNPPSSWYPSQEDMHTAKREDNLFLDLASHPSFELPCNGGGADLSHHPEDSSFWAHLRHLKTIYGVAEDDVDSGFSICNTPRPADVLPSTDLEQPFFKAACSSGKATEPRSSKTRKVHFAPRSRSVSPSCRKQILTLSGDSTTSDSDSGLACADDSLNGKEKDQNRLNDPCNHVLYEQGVPRSSSPIKQNKKNVCDYELNKESNNNRKTLFGTRPCDKQWIIRMPNQGELQQPKKEPVAEYFPRNSRQSRPTQNGENIRPIIKCKSPEVKSRRTVSDSQNSEHEWTESKSLMARKRRAVSISVVSSYNIDTQEETTEEEDNDSVISDCNRKSIARPVVNINIKKNDKGLGLGLIDGLYTPLRLAGIYIRKILQDSPAAVNGQLQIGDRLLTVNGKSIVGADYQSAMKVIRAAGETLTLLVAKGNQSIAWKVTATTPSCKQWAPGLTFGPLSITHE